MKTQRCRQVVRLAAAMFASLMAGPLQAQGATAAYERCLQTLSSLGFQAADISSYPIHPPYLERDTREALKSAAGALEKALQDAELELLKAKARICLGLAALVLDDPGMALRHKDTLLATGPDRDKGGMLLMIANARLGRQEDMNAAYAAAAPRYSLAGAPLALTETQSRDLQAEILISRLRAEASRSFAPEAYRAAGAALLLRAGIELQSLARYAWNPVDWSPETRWRVQAALEQFQMARERGMGADPYNALGEALGYISWESYDTAAEVFVKPLAVKPQSALTLFAAAAAAYESKDYKKALEYVSAVEAMGQVVSPAFKEAALAKAR